MQVRFSDKFNSEFGKIKDSIMKIRLWKQFRKLERLPFSGKPLSNELKNKRSIRVPPFRIIYHIDGEFVIIETFGHRKDIYEK